MGDSELTDVGDEVGAVEIDPAGWDAELETGGARVGIVELDDIGRLAKRVVS